MSTIEDLIQDYRDIANAKAPEIPYNLHEGLAKIQSVFGKASNAMAFFEEYRRTRKGQYE
jgi:hypothetical protein